MHVIGTGSMQCGGVKAQEAQDNTQEACHSTCHSTFFLHNYVQSLSLDMYCATMSLIDGANRTDTSPSSFLTERKKVVIVYLVIV